MEAVLFSKLCQEWEVVVSEGLTKQSLTMILPRGGLWLFGVANWAIKKCIKYIIYVVKVS